MRTLSILLLALVPLTSVTLDPNRVLAQSVLEATTLKPYVPKNAKEKAVLESIARRRAKPAPTVTQLVIVDNYALYSWVFNQTKGQTILKQDTSGRWQIIQGAHGAFDPGSMIRLGIPRSIAVRLFNSMQPPQRRTPVPVPASGVTK